MFEVVTAIIIAWKSPHWSVNLNSRFQDAEIGEHRKTVDNALPKAQARHKNPTNKVAHLIHLMLALPNMRR